MCSNEDLRKLLVEGFDKVDKKLKTHEDLLTEMKSDIKNTKEEMKEVKNNVEKNSSKADNNVKKIAALESQIQELIKSDQDHRRRNGRRYLILV